MKENLVFVSDEDAMELTNTIVEVEACKKLYEDALRSVDCVPTALKIIMDYYMQSLKVHKAVWRNLLVKHVGIENAEKFQMLYRFDTFRKVIFKIQIEGCQLCKG